MDIDFTFWKNRRVLVTGHTGFKGAWLSFWLHHLGAHVGGYALEPDGSGSLFQDAGIATFTESVIGDIRDLAALFRTVKAFCPEVVFHLAAQPLVRVSYDCPVETFATNVMGTVNLLEALRRVGGVGALVVVTTDKVYENHELARGYTEVDRLGGHDPYASSKACSEMAVSSYRRSFPDCPPVATARAGNVIGGGDRARDRLIPDVIGSILAGRAPLIRFPQAIRPWQHVLDPLSGYLLLAQKVFDAPSDFATAWNFGPNRESHVSVEQLLGKLIAIWGGNVVFEIATGSQPHETSCLYLDSSLSRRMLCWKPRWSLDEALAQTVTWWKTRSSGADIQAEMRHQIELYTSVE